MTTTTAMTEPEPTLTGARRWVLPNRAAFYLLASIVTFFLASSSAPTPLYAVYQGEWGFSPITTTVVFGVYAVAVLVALLTVGSLSDYLGRRPILLVAIAVQAVTMWIFATADGVPQLMAARVVQGLATGAAVGAVGAGLLDLDRPKGTIANAVAPLTGTALGGVISGLFVTFLPLPTRLVYVAFFAVFVAQAIGVALMAEPSGTKPGGLSSLRPEVALPLAVRGAVFSAIPVLVAIWALAGFYGSLGPALVRHIAGSSSLLLGGAALFALAGSGAVAVVLMRGLPPQRVMTIGIVALLVGVATTLLAVTITSALVFFLGAVVAGAGFGGGMQGAIRTVVPLAAAHERAGVLSVLYVVCYLGMGVPAVVAGYFVVHGGGLVSTARDYGVAVIVLAAVTLVASTVRSARSARLRQA